MDAAYLVIPGDRSCIYGHYYLTYHPTNPNNHSDGNTKEPILTECNTSRHVVGYAAEAETIELFINGQLIIPIRDSFEDRKIHFQRLFYLQHLEEAIQITGYEFSMVTR